MYLAILSLLAVSFMLFQIAVLRELRFQLSTVFTLTPLLFSGVLIFIGLGSLAAGRVRASSHRVLAWSSALLPLLLLPLFAVVIALSQGLIDHSSEVFAYQVGGRAATVGDAYIRSILVAFVAVGLLGYGVVFFLQGLIFALYFRESRESGVLSNVYAVDLASSGFGALLGGALCFVLTPIQLVMVSSALLLVNLWLSRRYLRMGIGLAGAVTVVALGLVAVEATTGSLERLEAPR